MKGIIIYKGKYGATQQYAKWLGEELHLPVVSSLNIYGKQLALFDYFLLGSSVYIGKLQIARWLKENADLLTGKKIFFFQVAATPADNLEKRMPYNTSGIPARLISGCRFFFLDGRMDVKKLTAWDRFLLKMGARMTRDPAAKKEMLKDFNNVKKENLKNLLDAFYEFTRSKKNIEAKLPV